MVLNTVLGALALLSLVLLLWQWFVAFRFPLHRRMSRNCSVPQKDYSDSAAAESSPNFFLAGIRKHAAVEQLDRAGATVRNRLIVCND